METTPDMTDAHHYGTADASSGLKFVIVIVLQWPTNITWTYLNYDNFILESINVS